MKRQAPRPLPPSVHPGLPARRRACELIEAVLLKRRPLDEALQEPSLLSAADNALARKIAATTLRWLGSIDRILSERLAKGLPDGLPRLGTILRTGVCQILLLDLPDYAAVDCAVRMVEANGKTKGFAGLTNAVLRGISRDKVEIAAAMDPADNLPAWLRKRWQAAYGADTVKAMAATFAVEPPLDLSAMSDANGWAARLGGAMTPTGTVRLKPGMAIPDLDGFGDGAWWVQDAAAAIPARLLGDVKGLGVADICAAPGGKTAQLAAAGAKVTAVDRSARRLERLSENMARLKLNVETIAADATDFSGSFDAVLLDAPCSATGTIRRNPDVMHLKSTEDIETLGLLQARLLDRLPDLVKSGGRAVYCTCSLEPEEGERQIEAFLARDDRMALDAIGPKEIDGIAEFVTPAGYLRTLPSHWPNTDPVLGGLDGFFAARLIRR